MLNSIVDRIFVITTLNSNRVNYIKQHLNDNGVTYDFFIAPSIKIISNDIKVSDGGDLTDKNHPALLSLISAYASIVEMAKIQNIEKICVIEDDCYLYDGWQSKLEKFMENLPDNWDILNLGYHPLHDTDTAKETYNEYVNIPIHSHHTTHCMVLKNTCYDEFLHTVDLWDYTIPVDYMFNRIYKNYKSFYPVEKFIYQLSVRNDEYLIENVNVRFKSLLMIT